MGAVQQFLNFGFDRVQVGINTRDKSPLLVNQHAGRNTAAAELIEYRLVFVRQQRVRHLMLVAERF